MATVDETVREMILAYPTLATNRTKALSHILCTSGNGYDWVNGEAVPDGLNSFAPWTPERQRERQNILEDGSAWWSVLPEDVQASFRKEDEDYIASLAEVVRTVDDRIKESPTAVDCGPQSEYTLLMTMPENVTEDWRKACEQMREIASMQGWSF